MMKKKSLIIYVVIFLFFFSGLLAVALNTTITSSSTSNNYDLKSSAVDFSNGTVVSDGYDDIYWNDGDSGDPAIAVDSSDKVHAVWYDEPVPPVVSAPGGIPFGNFYILFIAVSIIGLVVYKKRKI